MDENIVTVDENMTDVTREKEEEEENVIMMDADELPLNASKVSLIRQNEFCDVMENKERRTRFLGKMKIMS